MNEVQAYRAVYGDLVNCVPHYKNRMLLTIQAFKNRQAMETFRTELQNRRKELEDYLTPSRKR